MEFSAASKLPFRWLLDVKSSFNFLPHHVCATMSWWRRKNDRPPFSLDVSNGDEEVFSRDRLTDLLQSNDDLVVLRSNLRRFPGRLPASYVFTRDGLQSWVSMKGTHPVDRDLRVTLNDIIPLPAAVRAQAVRNIRARRNGAGPSTQQQGRGANHSRGNGFNGSNEEMGRAIAASLANQGRNGRSNDELNRAIAASLANQARPNEDRAIAASLANHGRGASSTNSDLEYDLAVLRFLANSQRRRRSEVATIMFQLLSGDEPRFDGPASCHLNLSLQFRFLVVAQVLAVFL
jgi:hypothetical protein